MPSFHPIPRLALLGLATLGFLSSTASAASNQLVVTTTSDIFDAVDQKCSLREALVNSNANFALSPEPGECPAGSGSEMDVIVLQSGEDYALTLQGSNDYTGDLDVLNDPDLPEDGTDLRFATSDAGPATIRQTVAGERVMQISKARVEIANIVMRDGDSANEYGGGLLFEGESLLLDRVSLTANKAGAIGVGGGLASMGGPVTLVDSHVSYNSGSAGGGIFSSSGSGPLLVRRTMIQGNKGSDGGGIHTRSELIVEDASSIVLNEASSYGGGIFAFDDTASVKVSNSTFESNASGSFGGAVSADLMPLNGTARVTFFNTVFKDNQAFGPGGAISSYGMVEITGGHFANNTSSLGGAVFVDIMPLHVSNTSFTGNKAGNTGQGGAIYSSSLFLNNGTFEQNSAMQGGALFVAGQLDVADSRFALNTAAEGGALYLYGAKDVTSSVVRSLFRDNIAQNDGGAVWTKAPALTIANTTISGNSVVTGTGAGLFIEANGAMTAINTTVAWNAPGVSVAKFGDLTFKNSIVTSPETIDCEASQNSPMILSLGNNLSDDNSCFGLNDPSDKTNVDVLLAPLADNGGGTMTHALLDGSPAIDAGDGIACAAEPVANVDQRGETRQAGLNCDIGAALTRKRSSPIRNRSPCSVTSSNHPEQRSPRHAT